MRTLEAWALAYLFNSLWQIVLVFAAAWLAAHIARQSGPAIEHRIWVAALLLEAVLPAVFVAPEHVFRSLWIRSLLALLPWSLNRNTGVASITIVPGEGYVRGTLGVPSGLLAILTIVYGCCVLIFVMRLILGLRRTYAIRARSGASAADASLERIGSDCRRAFGVEYVALAHSHEISGPVTIGVRQRVVLLPAGMQACLSEEDLHAAVAHEFAHIRRRDFAKNLIYEVLSLPAAYHPLLWLTRSRLAESREMLCDAIAADAVTGAERYARSLLRLARLVVEAPAVRSLHAIGMFDVGVFERRIMNLTLKHIEIRGARRLATVAACVLIGIATCASAMALRTEVSTPAIQSGEQPVQPARQVRVSGGVMAGNVLTKAPPVYPPEAKAAGITGTVVLHAVIGRDGAIQDLQVISGPEELRQSALEAVRQWTYKPYLLNGNPTEVETTINVNYSLRK